MTLEKQPQEFSSSPSVNIQKDVYELLGHQESLDNKSNGFDDHEHLNQDETFFIAKVRPFDILQFLFPQTKELTSNLVFVVRVTELLVCIKMLIVFFHMSTTI